MTFPAAFADFALASDSSSINNPDQIAEAVSKRSAAWRRLFKGKSSANTLPGGENIKTYIQLAASGQAHTYSIGDVESPVQPQTVSETTLAWRFYRTDITYDDETVIANMAGKSQSHRNRWQFNFYRQIERAALIDKYTLMETNLAATPAQNMDSLTAGKDPQALFGYLISGETNTLPLNVTTIQGLSPATNPNWKNQVETYAGTVTTLANHALLKALSKMGRKVKFTGLPRNAEYSDRATMPAVIWCSISGVTFLEDVCRATQDAFTFLGKQDPTYPHPTVHGVTVEEIEILTDATIYTDDAGTGFGTEAAAGTAKFGPRYFFCNLDDIFPVFNSSMFFHKHALLTPYGQPTRHTIYIDTWANICCINRRTQGIVTPASDITGYDAY